MASFISKAPAYVVVHHLPLHHSPAGLRGCMGGMYKSTINGQVKKVTNVELKNFDFPENTGKIWHEKGADPVGSTCQGCTGYRERGNKGWSDWQALACMAGSPTEWGLRLWPGTRYSVPDHQQCQGQGRLCVWQRTLRARNTVSYARPPE